MEAVPPRSVWCVRDPAFAPGMPQCHGLIEPNVDAIPVRVVIEQNGFVTGWDDGALGFEEDAIWFSGDATSFWILAADLDFWWLPDEDVMTKGVLLRHVRRIVRLRFSLAAPHGERSKYGKRFVESMKGLRRKSHEPRPEGQSQYPPLRPRPGAAVWRPRIQAFPRPGSTAPVAALLERTGLARVLTSDLAFLSERRRLRQMLREIEQEEGR